MKIRKYFIILFLSALSCQSINNRLKSIEQSQTFHKKLIWNSTLQNDNACSSTYLVSRIQKEMLTKDNFILHFLFVSNDCRIYLGIKYMEDTSLVEENNFKKKYFVEKAIVYNSKNETNYLEEIPHNLPIYENVGWGYKITLKYKEPYIFHVYLKPGKEENPWMLENEFVETGHKK